MNAIINDHTVKDTPVLIGISELEVVFRPVQILEETGAHWPSFIDFGHNGGQYQFWTVEIFVLTDRPARNLTATFEFLGYKWAA